MILKDRNSSRMQHSLMIPVSFQPNNTSAFAKEVATDWSQIKTSSSCISRRSNHSAVIFQDELYVYGGYESCRQGIMSDFRKYSFKEEKWSALPISGSPGPRHCHSAVVLNRAMLIFGGVSSLIQNTHTLFSYDFDNQSWWELHWTGVSPQKIDSHQAVVWNDQMIVYGGFGEGEFVKQVYSWDNQKWEVLWNGVKDNEKEGITYPIPRSNCSVTIYQDNMYIFAGKNLSQTFNDLWSFSLKQRKFSKINLSSEPFSLTIPPRCGHTAILLSAALVIFGGTSGVTHEKNDLVYIDLQTGVYRVWWQDGMVEIGKKMQASKRVRRDSIKKSQLSKHSNTTGSIKIIQNVVHAKKYRQQLKEVNYYNSPISKQHYRSMSRKKTKKNQFYHTLHLHNSAQNQSLNLSSTFQIINNSLHHQSKHIVNQTIISKQQSFNYLEKRKIPKARDNHSAELWLNDHKKVMVVFGGDMHKICFNDLILVQMDGLQERLRLIQQ